MISGKYETIEGKARPTKGNINAPGNIDTICTQIAPATPISTTSINGRIPSCLPLRRRFAVLNSYCCEFLLKSMFTSKTYQSYLENIFKMRYYH